MLFMLTLGLTIILQFVKYRWILTQMKNEINLLLKLISRYFDHGLRKKFLGRKRF